MNVQWLKDKREKPVSLLVTGPGAREFAIELGKIAHDAIGNTNEFESVQIDETTTYSELTEKLERIGDVGN